MMEDGGGEYCGVKVAVHIRPLIEEERLQGSNDCVAVVPGMPQVQIGTHSFTFDHVYGSTASPSSAIFEECVAPLVDGLFQGYNATVLAYGQTGSGKTYTVGTGGKDVCQSGIIHQVMDRLFDRIDNLKHQASFQLHVSFIEILKEEVRDLLDTSLGKREDANGHSGKVAIPLRAPVQIRETSNGVITLIGSTEVDVHSRKEMATCLEQGSFNRATGSTNMNNQSSRSHAIFTIALEQMRKLDSDCSSDTNSTEKVIEDYLCAKLHLVDLAGSERAKRTGSDGLRFKEGVHINRGLLALGNVISALGDGKKRKEGTHVPYRDSKLTRLLQDSLGGNSSTVMIACISPADINAEETLNTLKYANRARNIQNKPMVNRDPSSTEILSMRQQIEYLQAELLVARGGACSSDEVQVLKDRISWLESANRDLYRELSVYRSKSSISCCERDPYVYSNCFVKGEELQRNLDDVHFCDCQMNENIDDSSKKIDKELAKEWEHNILQNTMSKELNELNKRLEQKESEMKFFGVPEIMTLKKHFGQKLMELEDEKRVVQQERDHLLAEVESLATTVDGQVPDHYLEKLKSLEAQISDLKKKQENQVILLKQKQKSDEAAKKLQQEIQSLKAQKVQLLHKIKQETEQFRQWKASCEKELLQLKKEGRRNEYQKHKLEALYQRQKMVLQRKTEVAVMATKRLKELLEACKSSSYENSNCLPISTQLLNPNDNNEKSMQKWLEQELEVMVNMHEVHAEYERQSDLRAALAEELMVLKQSVEIFSTGLNLPDGRSGHSRLLAMSPDARLARVASLENMLNVTSNTLVAMASQLSEAEERDRASGYGRWNTLRSVKDARSLLQHLFDMAVSARCQLQEKESETKKLKEQGNELIRLLRVSDMQRKEMEKQLEDQKCNLSLAMSSTPQNPNGSLKHSADCTPLSPIMLPAHKQIKYTLDVANSSAAATLLNSKWMIIPTGRELVKKQAPTSQSGKLWRWKRSHHRWLIEFKWKWQKPWKLSEWVQNSDETMMRLKPNNSASPSKECAFVNPSSVG